MAASKVKCDTRKVWLQGRYTVRCQTRSSPYVAFLSPLVRDIISVPCSQQFVLVFCHINPTTRQPATNIFFVLDLGGLISIPCSQQLSWVFWSPPLCHCSWFWCRSQLQTPHVSPSGISWFHFCHCGKLWRHPTKYTTRYISLIQISLYISYGNFLTKLPDRRIWLTKFLSDWQKVNISAAYFIVRTD